MNEVIIDGVNVAKCKNFSCGICEEENKIPRTIGHFTADCTFYPNCYFKQLQCAKAEAKNINIAYMNLVQEIIAGIFYAGEIRPDNLTPLDVLRNIKKENKDLKAENEKLKKEVKEIRTWEELKLSKYRKALEDIKNNCVEILATIEEEGKPNHSIVDTIWCKNIPCCTLWELIEGMQREINEVLND